MLGGKGRPLIRTYEDIYKLSCKEENMSPVLTKTHPDLGLRSPHNSELQQDIVGPLHSGNTDVEWVHVASNGFALFDALPAPIFAAILEHVLVFDGQSIHAISRLDPHNEPDQVPQNVNGRDSLLHRFHVGRRKANVTFATNPQVMLAPLRVNKTWCFVGVNLFYGKNTFAFSSLGE